MRFKNLERFRTGGTATKPMLSIPLPRTPGGRTYRYSPNETAHPRHFVIGPADEGFEVTPEARARMKLEPRSAQTVCPYSGVIADDQAFGHPDDRDAAVELVSHLAAKDMRAEIDRMMAETARRSGGLIKYKPSRSTSSKPAPHFARHDLMRELVCDHCGRDYAVFAIALFCPDCGAPNPRLHFAREVALVDAQVELADALEEGQQELAYRLLGNAHEDVLTAFESMLKTVYLYGMALRGPEAPPFKPVGNDFQNVDRAQRRFLDLGLDPFDGLQAGPLDVLRLNIQKRHIIGHNLSVVDSKFAQHAEDAKVGETVRLVGEDIRVFAALSQAVVDRLDLWLAGDRPAPSALAAPASAANPIAAPMAPLAEAALDQYQLGATARRLGKWLASQSTEGRTRGPDREAMAEAFAGVTDLDLEDAVAELAAEGFVTTSHDLGARLPHVALTLDLYAVFDPIVRGTSPMDDAGALAVMVLEIGESISVPDLHAQSTWPLRQFNPALGILISQIDERRVSKMMGSEYPTRSFHLMADDRVALKRFAARFGGERQSR